MSARPSRRLGETSALIPPPRRSCLHCHQDASPVVCGLDTVVDVLLIPVHRAHEQDVTKAEEEETRGSLAPPLLHPGGSSAAALPESLDDAEQSQSSMGQVKSPHSVVVAICAASTWLPSESFGAPTGARSATIDSAFGVLFFMSREVWLFVFYIGILPKMILDPWKGFPTKMVSNPSQARKKSVV